MTSKKRRQPRAPPEVLAAIVVALQVDVVYTAVAARARARDVIRLSMTCQALHETHARVSTEFWASLPAAAIARRGHVGALRLRLRRSGFAAEEADAAFVAAALHGKLDCLRWLAVNARPSQAGVDQALRSAAEGGRLLAAEWIVGRAPLPVLLPTAKAPLPVLLPTAEALQQTFVGACERGALGTAQLAYGALYAREALKPEERWELVALGRAAAAKRGHDHVRAWAEGASRYLEQAYLT